MQLDVLHVLSSNRRRGAETFGYDLHCSLQERGVRSDVRSIESGTDERPLPVQAFGASRYSPAGWRALRRTARGAGVVVAHGSSTLLACGAGLAGTGVPFVYLSIGDPRYWAGSRSRRLRARTLIHRAAAVVAISPSARDVLVAHYGLDARKVHVIPNGRRASRFPPVDAVRRSAARRALGLPESADVVAVVGALGPEKRVDLAVTAAAQVDDVMLVVAGDGPEREALEARAARELPGRAVFLGATDGPETVLAAADLLALSSDSEGVPGVLIEAGLSGLPVVATDVGWVRDIVRDGETGLVVPPGSADALADAIREALARRDALGKGARSHCLTRFEMGPVTDMWQRLIEGVTAR